MASPTKKNSTINKKSTGICLGIIVWAVLAANFWRLCPPDPDCVKAVSLYTEIVQETTLVGLEYSYLTTTLGSFAAKKISENPITAALMVRLLKDAGISSNSVVAINASGSFPGFLLASLAACTALGIKSYVVASVGASSYGANMPKNTIADILLRNDIRKLNYTLLAITPGGSGDRGLELDSEELERIAEMLEKQNIPFIQPAGLINAVALRKYLFDSAGCTVLINIGGNHASSGTDTDLAFMSGVLKPNKKKTYKSSGIIQNFLITGKPVIHILNIKKLYAQYGLEFDETGNLFANTERLYRWKQLPRLVTLLPALTMIIVLGIHQWRR